MTLSTEVAKLLLDVKAVFLRPEEYFTWTSGIKSPVYCDNRLLISAQKSRERIVKGFLDYLSTLKLEVVAGTATAGIPWAAWIAWELKLPLIYVRSSTKEHGRQNAIEGQFSAGARCILIEDLISTGKSSIAAAQKLQSAGLKVEKVLSIFTYGFPEVEQLFQESNLSYASLTDFETLAQVAFQEKLLNTQTLEEVLNWKKTVKLKN